MKWLTVLMICSAWPSYINGQSFIQTHGSTTQNEHGVTLHRTEDGLIFLGGAIGDSALVQRLDDNGNVLWSRKFKPAGQYPTRVYDLQSAPDGSVIGCGLGIGPPPAVMHEGFHFRLDVDGNFQWVRSWIDSKVYSKRIMPLNAAEYLLFACHYDMSSNSYADVITARVNAINGDVDWVSPRMDLYSPVPYIDDITGATTVNSAHFATGRIFTNGNPVSTCRVNLSRYDLSGAHEWTKYLLYSNTMSRRMYGSDIIASNDSLVILFFGDIQGASSNYAVGLIQTDQDGQVAWAKSYDIQGSSQELSHKVIATTFGYLVSGQYSMNGVSRLFLLAVSHLGHVLWARHYGYPLQNQSMGNAYTKNLIAVPNGFLFTGNANVSSSNIDILLVRTDANGLMDCGDHGELMIITTDLPTASFSSSVVGSVGMFSLDNTEPNEDSTYIANTCDFLTLDLGPDTIICEEILLDATTPGATYLWQDGSVSNTFNVDAPGTYWVEIQVDCCTKYDTIIVGIGEPMLIDLGPDISQCEDSTTVILSTGVISLPHLWQDGSSEDSLVVTTSGTYWVQVGPAGCAASDTITVVIHPMPVIDLGPDTVLCVGNDLLLNVDPEFDQILWHDGSSASSFTVTESGQYSVEVLHNGCEATDSIQVLIIEPPVIDLGPDIAQCEDGTIIVLSTGVPGLPHLWNDGSTDGDLEVNESGIYWVVAGPADCASTDTVVVTLFSTPPVDLGSDSVHCGIVDHTLVSGYPASNTLWPDGSSASAFHVSSPGTYSVSVDVDGCIGTDSITIGLLEPPEISTSPDTVLCGPGSVLLHAVTNTTDVIQWQDGSIGNYFLASGPGLYWASVGNICGGSSDSTQISIAPEFPYPQDTLVCPGGQIRIALSGYATSIVWSHGSHEGDVHLSEGEYSYNAIDPFGCAYSGSFEIIVDPAADGLSFVPNVFTPDGNGVNDTFNVVGAERDGFRMEIFNRWGELIFTSTEVSEGWDGRYGGKEVPEGTYVYVVHYRSVCDDEGSEVQKGHVTVLR